jgi:hypothetical protein
MIASFAERFANLTFMGASRYILDTDSACLDQSSQEYETAAGGGAPVKHKVAAVFLKFAGTAHRLHYRFGSYAIEIAAGITKGRDFTRLH